MAANGTELVDFLYEVGLLKRYKRIGWVVAGVPDVESIADHSHRTAITAAVIASLEGADPQRAAFLALFHDTQETRTTDIPYLGKRYLKAASPAEVTEDQVRGLPAPLADTIRGAVREFEGRESAEAVCARDADKLECLMQAVEYCSQGSSHTQAWIDTSLAALKTASAKRLAEEALRRGPLEWMHETRDEKPPL
ncbi:HD family hydrolase [Streptomonospora nanhaiensis]|uniref:HD domain-containing protein n=1 Tax=Streptomonospora nanhaiensis TaxID=1323731 RepID=UPI001C39045F|nr:HD domain-containing protein [Streptomonospora nanhaiensis]MBV2365984.1 HD domain-containing protein [Streptomonospora nanhaiensis]MBX9388835.1 HD domain-containing protein [Streptomonospora nanhaiensis]